MKTTKTTLLLLQFFILTVPVMAQEAMAELRGTVKTSDGKPASFVSVILKELKKGVVTNEHGSYSFRGIKEGRYTLSVSFVGLETVESQVEISGRHTQIYDFTLRENRNELEEIVISTGYTANERTINAGKINIRLMDLPP